MSTKANSGVVDLSVAGGNGAQPPGVLPPPTVPGLRDPNVLVPAAEPTLGELAEMIAFQRLVLAKPRPCTGEECAEIVAAERTLQLLIREFRRRNIEAQPTSLKTHRRKLEPNVLEFDVPPSHRKHLGAAVTAMKRKAIHILRPFHVEMLRPQQDFNLAFSRVLDQLVDGHVSASPDPAAYIRQILEPLATPNRWSVHSHRSGRIAAAVNFCKRSYLVGLTPLLGDLLAAQHRWNLTAIDALLALSRSRTGSPPEAEDLIRRLNSLSDPFSQSNAPILEPIWREVLRKQVDLNWEITRELTRLLRKSNPSIDYQTWYSEREPQQILEASQAAGLKRKPLISIMTPAFNTPDALLRECIESVLKQTYENWQLCIVDDGSTEPNVTSTLAQYAGLYPRINFTRIGENSGIAAATNTALRLAKGDLVAFLDHDDVLAPHALAEIARCAGSDPTPDLIYSDEDRIDIRGHRSSPFFKPDWSPDLLRSVNYLCHLVAVRRELVEMVGGVREKFEGAQDYDLVLRLIEKASRIVHIPKILYHWRLWGDSLSQDGAKLASASRAGCRALSDHLQRTGEQAVVTEDTLTSYRVRYAIGHNPLVSIIIPFKDKASLLRRLVEGLLHNTTYQNFELLLISNNSTEPETFSLLDEITDRRAQKLVWDQPFNYPAINNFGAQKAQGELLLFLNNDMEIVDPGWLDELIGNAQRPEVGAVGAKLLFPDRSIQHAGAVVGLSGFAGHPFARLPETEWTAFGSSNWTRNFLAVTSACLMIRRELFEEIHGFDERFTLCGSDVDLGLRLVEHGKRIVYTPHAKLVHHESASRATDPVPLNDYWMSFISYRKWLRNGDPYYNPNLSLLDTDCGLRRDERDAETLSVQYLSALSETHDPLALSRAQQQRHIADHLIGLDHTLEVAREGRRTGPERIATLRKRRRLQKITWFIPFFKHPYGGVHTILRFGHQFRERHDVQSTFLAYDNPNGTARDLEIRVTGIYPDLAGSFQVLKSRSELSQLRECDLAIATFWSSAYFVIEYQRALARAYFVQDFEPQFYPASTYYGLAEQTYNLGLFGLFNSQGLHDFITTHYPMTGCWFEPAVDPAIFHQRRQPRKGPVRVFFYGRPATDRNAFELGISALHRLKQEMGAAVDIVSAGEVWSPQHYGLNGVVTNLGLLPYEKTADFYRSCDVGLCFMFTKHPSYLPLELMACGVAVVTNSNPANKWLFEHERNCLLAEPTSTCVLEQLRRVATDVSLRERISAGGARRLQQTTWEEQIDKVYEALTETRVTIPPRRPGEPIVREQGQRV